MPKVLVHDNLLRAGRFWQLFLVWRKPSDEEPVTGREGTMRTFSLSRVIGILFAVSSIVSFSSVAHADVPAKPADQAAQLVQRALLAEAEGKPDDRVDY